MVKWEKKKKFEQGKISPKTFMQSGETQRKTFGWPKLPPLDRFSNGHAHIYSTVSSPRTISVSINKSLQTKEGELESSR